MNKYICVSPDKEAFNINGESLGMRGERALYYSKDIGKNRVYRQSYPIEPYFWGLKDLNENMKLFEFNNKQKAQELCDEINSAYGDDFEVKLLEILRSKE